MTNEQIMDMKVTELREVIKDWQDSTGEKVPGGYSKLKRSELIELVLKIYSDVVEDDDAVIEEVIDEEVIDEVEEHVVVPRGTRKGIQWIVTYRTLDENMFTTEIFNTKSEAIKGYHSMLKEFRAELGRKGWSNESAGARDWKMAHSSGKYVRLSTQPIESN